MNIRNYVSNDHVMSVNEIATSQAQMIQLLTIEINDKDKEIDKLQKQLEAYENMRKEVNKWVEDNVYLDYYGMPVIPNNSKVNELIDILNKVGGSDE